MIYVISDGNGHLKVGRSDDLERRFQNLQTGDADKHDKVAVVRLKTRAAEVVVEHAFHVAFKQYASGGGTEWYNDCPAVRAWVQALSTAVVLAFGKAVD